MSKPSLKAPWPPGKKSKTRFEPAYHPRLAPLRRGFSFAPGGAQALQAIEEAPGGFPIAVFDISLSDMRIEKLADQLPATHGIETLVLCSGGTAEDFDSAQAAFERLGVSIIHRRKKPVGIADFRSALL